MLAVGGKLWIGVVLRGRDEPGLRVFRRWALPEIEAPDVPVELPLRIDEAASIHRHGHVTGVFAPGHEAGPTAAGRDSPQGGDGCSRRGWRRLTSVACDGYRGEENLLPVGHPGQSAPGEAGGRERSRLAPSHGSDVHERTRKRPVEGEGSAVGREGRQDVGVDGERGDPSLPAAHDVHHEDREALYGRRSVHDSQRAAVGRPRKPLVRQALHVADRALGSAGGRHEADLRAAPGLVAEEARSGCRQATRRGSRPGQDRRSGGAAAPRRSP